MTVLTIDDRLSLLEAQLGIGVVPPVVPVAPLPTTTTTTNELSSISSRVDALYESMTLLFKSTTTTNNNTSTNTSTSIISTLEQNLIQCETLAKSLDAQDVMFWTISINHNNNHYINNNHTSTSNTSSTSSTPLIYRNQEVLARSEELQTAFDQLNQIRDLLSISNTKLIQALQLQKHNTTTNNNNTNNNTSSSSSSSSSQSSLSLDHIANAPILVSTSFQYASNHTNQERLHQLSSNVDSINERTIRVIGSIDHIVHVYYNLILAMNEKFILLTEGIESTEGRHK